MNGKIAIKKKEIGNMPGKKEKKKLAILEILKYNRDQPLPSYRLAEVLNDSGFDISERTVRLYLQTLEDEGLVQTCGKKGRQITEAGLKEIGLSKLLERVGFMSAKIDQMTFRMTFDLTMRRGLVVMNTSLVDKELFLDKLDMICQVFDKGYALGSLVSLLKPGERFNNLVVPEGMIGFCSVCSITLNGVLLKHGIPMRSLFSGLVELIDSKPYRFAEIIHYDATSIDPLELFIKGRMTDYIGAITTGNGRIGAGFREMPAESYEVVCDLADQLKRIGLGAFMTIGQQGQPIYQIPVREGCIGAAVIGGLNPIAILEESGHSVQAFALSGLMEFSKLFPYHELRQRLNEM